MKQFVLFILFLLNLQNLTAQKRTAVNLISKTNFSIEADSILALALPLIDSVINSPAFKEGILTAKFVNTGGLSNLEILELFLSGREVHRGVANDTMDLILETYPDQNGNNIGTTYGASRIKSSEAYISRNGAKCYGAHIIHEYCHTIGKAGEAFTHRHTVITNKHKRQKCQSVPYIIGDLARKILGLSTCHCQCEDYPQS